MFTRVLRFRPMCWCHLLIKSIKDIESFAIRTTIQIMLPMLLKLLIFTFVKQVWNHTTGINWRLSIWAPDSGDLGQGSLWGRPVSSDCPHSTAHKRKSQINFWLGLLNWLNEVEVFAMLFAAAIHDYEHTGTTNTFHQQTRSNLGSFRVHTFSEFHG